MPNESFIKENEKVPAPGGGVFEGLGGQAPKDATPPSSGAGAPTSTPYPNSPIFAAGGQAPPGLPPTVPGQFQPGGGHPTSPYTQASQAAQMQTQQSMPRSGPGFLAHITPVSGDVSRVVPISGSVPEYGPGKPRGLKPLPLPKDKKHPDGPPKPPGQWVTLDGGKGQPPAYGFIAHEESGPDVGLGKTTSFSTTKEKGHYVYVAVGEAPAWCWVPTIDDSYGVEPEPSLSSSIKK